jgi:hypothetical protein
MMRQPNFHRCIAQRFTYSCNRTKPAGDRTAWPAASSRNVRLPGSPRDPNDDNDDEDKDEEDEDQPDDQAVVREPDEN